MSARQKLRAHETQFSYWTFVIDSARLRNDVIVFCVSCAAPHCRVALQLCRSFTHMRRRLATTPFDERIGATFFHRGAYKLHIRILLTCERLSSKHWTRFCIGHNGNLKIPIKKKKQKNQRRNEAEKSKTWKNIRARQKLSLNWRHRNV